MDKRLDLSRLATLREEIPKSLMGRIRMAWPDIQSALDRGHALKVVHERLNECGVRIGYRHLAVYIGRLRRENSGAALSKSPKRPQKAEPLNRVDRDLEKPTASATGAPYDPLANVKERTKKRPGFQFSEEPADEDELI